MSLKALSLNTLYVRAWSWCAGLLVVIWLLLWLVSSLLNDVRAQAFSERYPAPLIGWLAQHPDAINLSDWLDQSISFNLRDIDELSLDDTLRQRLAWGQVVAEHRGDGVWLLYAFEDGYVLEAWFKDLYRDVAELSALSVGWSLDHVPSSERQKLARALEDALAVHVQQLGDAVGVLPQDVLEQLADIGFAYHQRDAAQAASLYVRLEDGEIYQVNPPAPFDPWRWPILLPGVLLVGTLLAMLVVVMVGRLHQRMRAIENVVSRIARGELEARVKVEGDAMVDRLGDAFNSMAEHIQRLVHVQREMIHAVSHELRTPVARIRFGVQMIEDCPDEASVRKQLAGIDADIQELDELIDEILTYARLEQGGPILAFQETDVARIVEQVAREQKVPRPGLNIHAVMDIQNPRWTLSDVEPRYIHRAIQNLVGNAARYASSEVRITCRCDKETCRIDVEDDGPGVPEADWERIFTPFARLDDSRTRKSGGYGLGLSIVRRILYWHGGQAFVGRSDSLGGAAFSLVWPRKQGNP